MLDYDTCVKLKGAGWPQKNVGDYIAPDGEVVYSGDWNEFNTEDCVDLPTIEELIEAVGRVSADYPWGEDAGHFDFCLQSYEDEWTAGYKDPSYHESWGKLESAKTADEAVANLYLALHK